LIEKTIKHRDKHSKTFKNIDGFDENKYPIKLQHIFLSRGIQSEKDLDYRLSELLSPHLLLNTDIASEIIFTALRGNKKILIVGDFDADGATSTALMIKALTALGAKHVSFLVPDRFQYGYGLSVKLVEHAALTKPDLIITVDNGIANHEGVDKANELGMAVLITDHHLPAETLPSAVSIVNPNQSEDDFPSKNLAGVGVAFYLMLALRSLMRSQNWFIEHDIAEPNLSELLDLVALGTVADVVALDKNNRILVEQGLKRIRSGQSCFGIKALLKVARKNINQCQASDLGFAIGPRLNAAGRLEDMSIGINCLLASSEIEAEKIAQQLDSLNRKRREIEQGMSEQANQVLNQLFSHDNEKNIEKNRPNALCLYQPNWHQGVIGILASRVKEKINRPVIVFAKDEGDGLAKIKGSARSVAGVHVRDVLALVDSKNPDLIEKFGGHAMAAGLTLKEKDLQFFEQQFSECTTAILAGAEIVDEIMTDAGIDEENLTINFARQIRSNGPWGQGFPEPSFDDEFQIVNHRIVGEKHLKLVLKKGDLMLDAICFFFDQKLQVQEDDYIHAVFKLDINEFRNIETLQLIIEQLTINKNSSS